MKSIMRMTKLAGPALVALLSMFALMAPAHAQFGGCGVGLHAGVGRAAMDTGTPIAPSATGQMAGLSAFCNLQAGQMVLGGFGEYDKLFGDVKTLGVESNYGVGALAGVVAVPNTLLYLHASRQWWEVQNSSNLTGFKFGAGVAIKLPVNAPLDIDIRYSHGVVDNTAPLTVSSDELRLGFNYRFSGGLGTLMK